MDDRSNRRRLFTIYSVAILLSLLVAENLTASPAKAAPSFSEASQESNAGYYTLTWEKPENQQIELQEKLKESPTEFKTIYRGSDSARTFSGKPNGLYLYRLRYLAADSEWSEMAQVQVKHHSLERALIFLTLGGVVFISTLVFILLAYRHEKRSGSASSEGRT